MSDLLLFKGLSTCICIFRGHIFFLIYTLQTITNAMLGQSVIMQSSGLRGTNQHAKGTMASYMTVNLLDVKHVNLNAANQVIPYFKKVLG